MITIGITGTFGAGKGTVVEYLEQKGFKHYSVRKMLTEEIERRGIEPIRDNMQLVANDFRKISPGYIMEALLSQAEQDGNNAVIESLRAIGEVETLRSKAKTFYMFAVDADPKIRYERAVGRGSTTDQVTFEKFMEDEASEANNKEPWKMNVVECKKLADFVIINEGSKEELFAQVDEVLKKILK